MKAIVFTEYGSPDVLKLQEVPKPTPKENEVLVRITATPVGFGDITARNFKALTPSTFTMPAPLWLISRLDFGVDKPKRTILGSEFAGHVEAVGSSVTRFKPGDAVFGYPSSNFGANAEYICMAEAGLIAHKPSNMSDEEASATPYGAMTALGVLRGMNLQPGQKVLINGASGNIGSAALQIAKNHYGTQVTGVAGTPRLELMKALGADHVIDYKQEDFTQNGETYDLILDVLNKSSWERCKDSLTPNGRYLLPSFKLKQVGQMLWTSLTGSSKRVVCSISMPKQDDLLAVKELVEAGKIKTIIDRRFPLEQAADAHRYVESGQAAGKVILTVGEAPA